MSENKLWLKMSFGQKIQKTHNMHTRDTMLHIQQSIIIKKTHVKFQPDWLRIFREKVKKVNKSHELCINQAYLCMPQKPLSLIRCASP